MKTMILTTGKAINRQSGFTYLLALLAVAVVTITSGVTYTSSRYTATKAMEEELLFRGTAYYQAIKSYYLASTPRQYPNRLDDLLKDPRFLTAKRHIRQLYPAPKGGEWRVIYNKQKRIMGVHYDSEKKPIKESGFLKPFEGFAQTKKYSDWSFSYIPEVKIK